MSDVHLQSQHFARKLLYTEVGATQECKTLQRTDSIFTSEIWNEVGLIKALIGLHPLLPSTGEALAQI